MRKMLGKLLWWKRDPAEPDGPFFRNYGKYEYKPVIARALSVVMEESQEQIATWVQSPDIRITLNDEPVEGMRWALRRLESGNYEIKLSQAEQQDKIWRFFIA